MLKWKKNLGLTNNNCSMKVKVIKVNGIDDVFEYIASIIAKEVLNDTKCDCKYCIDNQKQKETARRGNSNEDAIRIKVINNSNHTLTNIIKDIEDMSKRFAMHYSGYLHSLNTIFEGDPKTQEEIEKAVTKVVNSFHKKSNEIVDTITELDSVYQKELTHYIELNLK